MIYANSLLRLKGAFADSGVSLFLLIIGAMIRSSFVENDAAGKYIFIVFLFLAALHEPILVTCFGASLGHKYAKIYVVDGKTGNNINIFKSLIRFFLKTLLGWLSILAISAGRKKLSLHDMLTNSMVLIRDTSKGANSNFVENNFAPENVSGPSLQRRGFVILGYMVVTYFIVGAAIYFLQMELALNEANAAALIC